MHSASEGPQQAARTDGLFFCFLFTAHGMSFCSRCKVTLRLEYISARAVAAAADFSLVGCDILNMDGVHASEGVFTETDAHWAFGANQQDHPINFASN